MGTAGASPSSSALSPSSVFQPRCEQNGGLWVDWEHMGKRDGENEGWRREKGGGGFVGEQEAVRETSIPVTGAGIL